MSARTESKSNVTVAPSVLSSMGVLSPVKIVTLVPYSANFTSPSEFTSIDRKTSDICNREYSPTREIIRNPE